MDAQTMRMAGKYGLAQTVCLACHQPTLFIWNEKRTNMPRTCGTVPCLQKVGDPLGQLAPS